MATAWVTALKLIPWTDVIKAAPQVVKTAKGLLQKTPANAATPDGATAGVGADDLSAQQAASSNTSPSNAGELALQHIAKLQARIQTLEQAQHDSAQLIAQMAEQQAQVVQTVGVLRTGATRLAWLCALLGLALLGLAGYVWWG
ncbi:MAG: hypothetical protein KIG95_08850 [Comamonas sp.]|nr:hypothetical protein [Comamonas sp.]